MTDLVELGVEITFDDPETFLLIKETLTRLGVASNRTKTLYQSANILHKQGKYYIMHFKEMFKLDGKPSTITDEDIDRRNAIVKLLKDWGLLKIVNSDMIPSDLSTSNVKVLSFKDKNDWELVSKYSVGLTKRK